MDAKNKVAFVTGANRGIGFETVRELAEKGARVILGSRDKAKGEEAVKKLKSLGLETIAFPFDVNNLEDHKKIADYIEQKFGHLDILVNNAGVWIEAAPATETPQESLRKTFDANFFNLVHLTQTLLPLVRKAPAGRIVNLSSILSSLALHMDPQSPIFNFKAFSYNASKTALNAFTVHLAHELRDTKIKVNSAHPGWVKTDMGGASAPMEVADGGKTSVQLSLLDANGPTGGLFHMGERLPW